MSRLSPSLEFKLALFHFKVAPWDDKARERLAAAVDEYRRAPIWRATAPIERQLVTAAHRALTCKLADIEKALAGIEEVWAQAIKEASMEEQAAVARAQTSPPAQAETPPHTRWDERADLQ